ncbi:ketoacyl-ACP synthase III [Luteimonas fraxinea]|uniref:Ketoacyl-ACP synthase III n=1 Tax=Luteimonas fraxinea TaxID=2901869 RepID=A0ABS8UEA4_9GAMM|nr:3-oxoacyl-[acyl-carrier-protein] synthase III C-terminal domain-containing protein [Luteimonas fraxinea]MCD9097235.1 ketoacyl-ACP synthase III [Luteimonas fraxinea]MCD9125200.1 ketoacyl-ACP synthase III [Luteimonas fraxinea]UHH11501.1 ketoacyl-ACP synthase III [Luteimonas fraxinea]
MDAPAGLRILGTGCHHPAQRVASTVFDTRLGLAPGSSEAATGVAMRGVAGDDETASWMGARAAEAALHAAGIDASALDAIVSTCAVMEQPIPCQAALVQRALGLGGSGIPAFDINATCLGFLVALDLIAASIAAGRYRRVLVVASEVPSRGLRADDPVTAPLFGDGAAAVVLGAAAPGEDSALLAWRMETFADGADACRIRGGGTRIAPGDPRNDDRDAYRFEMDGPATFRTAGRRLPRLLTRLLESAGLTTDALDCIVPHQASGGGLDRMMQALRLPEARTVRILGEHGNQVAASLPHALHHAIHAGRLQRGQTCLLLGTGAGLSVGGAVLRY